MSSGNLLSPGNGGSMKEWLQRISRRSFNPVMYVDITDTTNSAGAETDLHSYTLPSVAGGYFWKGTGQFVRITSYGSFAGNANVKTLQAYLGGTSLYSFAQAANGGTYKLVSEINQIDPSSFEMFTTLVTSNTTYPAHVMRLGVAAAGTRLGEGAVVKTTGNGAGAADITERYFRVEQFQGPDAY